MSKTLLKLDKVTYSYKMKTGNNVNVIRSASGMFESEKIYALQSDKSGGKTTLLKLIAGLDQPDSGVISVNDKNTDEMDPFEYRSKVAGLALTGMDLVSNYTVMDNVLLQMDINKVDQPEERYRIATEILEFVGLEQSGGNRKVSKLSETEKKKVRLARALATLGEIILFDDMNTGLSKEETEEFLHLLKKTAREKLKCVIYATESSLVASMADECYTINRGTVIKVKKNG